jgi:RHS Repeat
MRALAKITTVLLATTCASAWAAETVTYTYDARGRLVAVSRAGTVNNGVATSYGYDKTDNRTNVTITTGGGGGMAAAPSPGSKEARPAPAQAKGAPK